MRDKLCVSERRTRIIEYLTFKKQTTRQKLSEEFGVSLATIDRDIKILGDIAPVYTQPGNQGGVYILPEHRSYKKYLTREEEQLLRRLEDKVEDDDREILERIIIKFAMSTAS